MNENDCTLNLASFLYLSSHWRSVCRLLRKTKCNLKVMCNSGARLLFFFSCMTCSGVSRRMWIGIWPYPNVHLCTAERQEIYSRTVRLLGSRFQLALLCSSAADPFFLLWRAAAFFLRSSRHSATPSAANAFSLAVQDAVRCLAITCQKERAVHKDNRTLPLAVRGGHAKMAGTLCGRGCDQCGKSEYSHMTRGAGHIC
ncbi:hypothetical protein GQ54DRAFT_144366 [Martensiomyces pterosporus]|nr:hypothetical protein GQ54DRAFT_144366 [Martensiomyces pterosporus]